uniref:Uncharacterized protein n=1 Tax=Sphaerodactylus townsendi TaxID=933632 RepID=A0ACB8FU76_9SAUR
METAGGSPPPSAKCGGKHHPEDVLQLSGEEAEDSRPIFLEEISVEDVLSKDAGECAICLEELQQGDTIARLPCLCIYHKGCIDEWFEVNRSCPEHPSD